MNQTLHNKSFLNPVIQVDETAKNISSLMKSSKLSVSELQNLFGFEQPQAIYNWRSGKTLPSLDNCLRLAYFLHTSVENLVIVEMKENRAELDVPEEFKLDQSEGAL